MLGASASADATFAVECSGGADIDDEDTGRALSA